MDSDISRDHVRRQLREIEAQHQATMTPMRQLVERVYEEDHAPETRADVVTGGLHRAEYLKIGGVAVASAAILAACSSSGGSSSAAGGGSTSTTAKVADPMDILALKTASSIEELAVVVYGQAIPLIKDATAKSVAMLFQSQHKDHAGLFEGLTTQAGAQAFTQPNPAVKASVVDPALPTLTSDEAILKFALSLELAAASTYFSDVGVFKDPTLASATMTVGGTEYRHVALLKYVLKLPIDPQKDAFITADQAVKVGTGVS